MIVPFATLPIVRRRYTGVQAFDAVTRRPVPQTPTTSTVYATIQPPTDRDLEGLPDGERMRQAFALYVGPDTLRVSDQHTGLPGDEVVIDGATYQVRRVERHRQVMPHDKAIVVRRQEIGP